MGTNIAQIKHANDASKFATHERANLDQETDDALTTEASMKAGAAESSEGPAADSVPASGGVEAGVGTSREEVWEGDPN